MSNLHFKQAAEEDGGDYEDFDWDADDDESRFQSKKPQADKLPGKKFARGNKPAKPYTAPKKEESKYKKAWEIEKNPKKSAAKSKPAPKATPAPESKTTPTPAAKPAVSSSSSPVLSEATIAKIAQLTATLESLTAKISAGGGAAPPPGAGAGGGGPSPPSVQGWEDFVTESVDPFIATCKKIGADSIATQCQKGFDNLGGLVRAAPNAKKPSPEELQKFLKPAIDAIGEADRGKDNRSDVFNHQSAWAECVGALGWVTISPAPMGHVQACLESGDFYMNKVLKSKKDAADKEDHRAFVRQLKGLLSNMKAYIKQYHTTGVEYKGKGGLDAAGGVPPPAAGGVPVPPGIPPPAAAAAPASAAGGGGGGGGGGGMSAVFAQISKGEGITAGLKKVKDSEKNKNKPKSERSGLVKSAPKKATKTWSAGAEQKQQKEPSIQLGRGQWAVEYHTSGDCRVPEGANMKQSVYIYKCGACIVRVPEKVKAITIDGCKKTRVVVNTVVSTVEVVNCQSVTVSTTGVVKSFAIDKTAGCQLWLNKETAEVKPDIISSNISEINIQVPGANPDDDPVEMAVPEQFTSKFVNGKLTTEALKHG